MHVLHPHLSRATQVSPPAFASLQRGSVSAHSQRIGRPRDHDPFEDSAENIKPLQRAASELSLQIYDLFKHTSQRSSSIDSLMGAVGELRGGLAQALSCRTLQIDQLDCGLALVQLKRALRGAAFAKGTLFPLRAAIEIDRDVFEELYTSMEQIEEQILDELNASALARGELSPDSALKSNERTNNKETRYVGCDWAN